VRITPDERRARAGAIETLRDAFCGHTRLDRRTAQGIVAGLLFTEAIAYYGGADADAARGFDRATLMEAVVKEAARQDINRPSDRNSLNQMVVRFTHALTAFVRTMPPIPLITTILGPTSVARGDRSGRTFLSIDFHDPPAPARRLPRGPAVLVGRAAEQARLRHLLTAPVPPAFVAVHGVPGVGRSALALKVIHDLLDDGGYDDAVRYAFEGAEVPTPREVKASILGITGAERRAIPDSELGALFLAMLAKHRTIVLLEDVPDGWPASVLAPPRGSVVVMTAQQFIRHPAIEGVAVAPLDARDAAALLVEWEPRLAEAVPEYAAAYARWAILGGRGERPHPTVASKLAALCGYAPAELLAAATALRERPELPAVVFLAWYERSMVAAESWASSASADCDARYAAAYARLTDAQRRVFRSIAIFAAAFTAQEGASVAGDPAAAAIVMELARAGLLTRAVEPERYDLPPPLRLFGQRLLARDPDRADIRTRFAAHYAALGEQLLHEQQLRLDRAAHHVVRNFEAAQRAAVATSATALVARFGYIAAYAHPPNTEVWLREGAEAVRSLADPALELHIAIGRVDYYKNTDLARAQRIAEDALAAVPAERPELVESAEDLRETIAQLGIRVAKPLGRARAILAFGAERLKRSGLADRSHHDTFAVLMAEAAADLGMTAEALRWSIRAVRDALALPRIYRANALITQSRALHAAGRLAASTRTLDAALALYPDAAAAADHERVYIPPQEIADPDALVLRDAYGDPAKLHPGLVAYALRTQFIPDPIEVVQRCRVVADSLIALGTYMPRFFVEFAALLVEFARRAGDLTHAAHAFVWLTLAIGLGMPRGVSDLFVAKDGAVTLPPRELEALTDTPFPHLRDARAVGNAYFHRGEVLLLLDDPRMAADDFAAAADVLAPIESPLLLRINQRLRRLTRARR